MWVKKRKPKSISKVDVVVPVRLPPGRFRLATSPSAIGSAATKKTIGMVVVAAFSASGFPQGQ
jgi:hypothetical protein